jgi:hypothetical protein
VLSFAAASCTGQSQRPDTLLDGSAARTLRVQLEGVDGPAVLTKVAVVRDGSEDRRAATCQRERAPDAARLGPLVRRVGVAGESVSFRETSGVRACDASSGRGEDGRVWCDGAFGRLHDGRLLDPRLSIGCRTDDDEPVAFAWVDPGPKTRYVAVGQPGFAEVYETVAGVPVRIASTADVDVIRARASFAVTEHDGSGRFLRRYELEAVVAG